ncbi:hypothetical protein F2P81_000980 [Scophthalmus maximus]|uniref:ZP domain-containing protein n=1 Tax=Scophthalmus maximus TaxID=52904 RepID=A0A6A4TKG5_SCOMX|nr:hypothetical protein F2P81_000980 [Scophthalmus maximus]
MVTRLYLGVMLVAVFAATVTNAEQLTGVAKTNVVPLGSFMPIWAAVEQKSHQPLLLLMEECVAATTPELHPGSQVHPIITNKGCLYESMRANSMFLPRYHSSAILLYLQSFRFGLGEEVYIHCKLVVWDPEALDESKKACQYVKDTGSVAAREAAFSVALNDCNFKRMVTGDHLLYTNDLTFISSPDSHLLPFSHPVVCAYERPKDWYPLVYDPVFNTYGQGDLVFHIGLMNVDFSGPAASTTFPLGSFIPIMASVEQNRHQPLLLLLEECVAAPTPEMQPGSPFYPIITNKGCLMDSKISGSKFEPRQKSSEIRLSLQTFKFSVDVEVYIHCELVAWDPFGLDNTKKACHYIKDHGWELLDDPEYSNLCDCCDSSCKSRRMRSIASDLTEFHASSPSEQCSVCGASCRYLPITDEVDEATGKGVFQGPSEADPVTTAAHIADCSFSEDTDGESRSALQAQVSPGQFQTDG